MLKLLPLGKLLSSCDLPDCEIRKSGHSIVFQQDAMQIIVSNAGDAVEVAYEKKLRETVKVVLPVRGAVAFINALLAREALCELNVNEYQC